MSSIGSRFVSESIRPPNPQEQAANSVAGQLWRSVRSRKTIPAKETSRGRITCSLKASSHGRIRKSQESG